MRRPQTRAWLNSALLLTGHDCHGTDTAGWSIIYSLTNPGPWSELNPFESKIRFYSPLFWSLYFNINEYVLAHGTPYRQWYESRQINILSLVKQNRSLSRKVRKQLLTPINDHSNSQTKFIENILHIYHINPYLVFKDIRQTYMTNRRIESFTRMSMREMDIFIFP